MKKKILIGVGILFLIIVVLVVIGSSSPSSVKVGNSNLALPAKTESDITALKSGVDSTVTYDLVRENPSKYKDKIVSWAGRVFVDPRKTDNGIELQVFLNDSSDKNFYVSYKDPNFQVVRDNFIVVYGVVSGTYKGTNLFGATLEIPKIEAGYVEKTDRAQAVAPAQKIITVGKAIEQKGFYVTLDKIELANTETRIYLSVKNNTKYKVSFYTYSAKLVQDGKQLSQQTVFGGDRKELPGEFLPGVTAEGIVVFPVINQSGTVKIVLDKPYAQNTSFEEMTSGAADFKEISLDVTY